MPQSAIAETFPDAPQPQQSVLAPSEQSPGSTVENASISGTVLDTSRAAIPGAQVSLLKDGKPLQSVKSGAYGEFAFRGLTAGSYLVTVEAGGFVPFSTNAFSITTQQAFLVPEISLSIAGSTTDVLVRPTEEIAAEQIKAEEKQRLLGVFPNFYVSYVPDAAPLTSRQKFSLAAHDTLDWTSFVGVSVSAGIEQATDAFSGYGQGAEGYAKRWGAQFADGRISDFLSHYVFASLLHQDPRYFYQGTGTTRSRLYHALSNGFVARSDSGKWMPNYSYLLGDICAGAISNAYYPASDRGASLVFVNSALGIAGRAAQGVVQEFVAKRLTKNVPPVAPSGTSQPAKSENQPASSQ